MSSDQEEIAHSRENGLPACNPGEVGLGILSRLIARRLIGCESHGWDDTVENHPGSKEVVKVARGSRGKRGKNARNKT